MSATDWNTQLRAIEREYDGLPPVPTPTEVRARSASERKAREDADRLVARIGAAFRLLLVGGLLAALRWWPYEAGCGPGLALLLVAQSMLVIGGAWIAIFAWRHRLAVSHTLAVALLVTGLALVAIQALPRMGYATFAGITATHWRCAP